MKFECSFDVDYAQAKRDFKKLILFFRQNDEFCFPDNFSFSLNNRIRISYYSGAFWIEFLSLSRFVYRPPFYSVDSFGSIDWIFDKAVNILFQEIEDFLISSLEYVN